MRNKIKQKPMMFLLSIQITLLTIIALLVIYPLYFIVIASFSDPVAINNGQITIFPIGFNLDGYKRIFENTQIWTSYGNTIFYTLVGTTINIFLTMLLAYPLSRQNFFLRKLNGLYMFTNVFPRGNDSDLLMDE